jgi:hypothetical protein
MRAMRMRVTSWVTAALLTLAIPFLPAAARIASADEGSPVAPMQVSPSIRPPTGVLRHADAPKSTTQPQSTTPSPTRELVVLVGGYQSCACPDDGTFDALKGRLAATGGFDVVRFGSDPKFPYDTYGAVAPNAKNLRDFIRSQPPEYGAVHIVTHSMGGVVADQAFAQGLSGSDRVATYVSLAAPHSGSAAARVMTLTQAIAGDGAWRDVMLRLPKMEPNSPAVRDLARARPVIPPAGVARLDLRDANDLLVTGRDAKDPGVTSRILIGAVEGHGGILTDRTALDQTLGTITRRRVPPDDRPLAVQLAAEKQSDAVGRVVLMVLSAVAGVLCGLWLFSKTPLGAPIVTCIDAVGCRLRDFGKTRLGAAITKGIGSFLPRAARKPCP